MPFFPHVLPGRFVTPCWRSAAAYWAPRVRGNSLCDWRSAPIPEECCELCLATARC
jgi:hypothetical protein